MEEKRIENEVKEKRLEKDVKSQAKKLAAQLELESLQLERAKVECENIEARTEVQSAASSQAGQENVTTATTTSGLPGFLDGKDNLDKYLFRFDRHATIAVW